MAPAPSRENKLSSIRIIGSKEGTEGAMARMDDILGTTSRRCRYGASELICFLRILPMRRPQGSRPGIWF